MKQKLLTYDEAQRIDVFTQQAYFIPDFILMERAGLASAHIFQQMLKEQNIDKSQPHVFVLSGGGNNGGDGLVLARELFDQGYSISVGIASQIKSAQTKLQFKIVQALSITHVESNDFKETLAQLTPRDWIIDAISGVGLTSEYRNKALIDMINKSKARVYSIDVPTGLLESKDMLKDYEMVHADVTVTMGLAKSAMYIAEQRLFCGTIIIADSVFPTISIAQANSAGFLLAYEDIISNIVPLDSNVYKHSRGVLAVAAGSSVSPGAALLAVKAATQGPVGLVYGLFDKDISDIVVAQEPSVISGKPIENISTLHALVVGPGWGKRESSELETLISYKLPMVFDADALRLVASTKIEIPQSKIFAPHLGELKILAASIPKYESNESLLMQTHWWILAQDVADYYEAVVIAKNSVSGIMCPSSLPIIIDGSNPLLATAGSGDVLAGIVGSILAFNQAQYMYKKPTFLDMCTEKNNIIQEILTHIEVAYKDLFLVALLGTLIHVRAGEILRLQQGTGNASDIISQISKVYTL